MGYQAKPPALEIPDGTSESDAQKMLSEYLSAHTKWDPDVPVTRAPPRTAQVTEQMIAASRQKSIRAYLDAPEPPEAQQAYEADLLKRAKAFESRPPTKGAVWLAEQRRYGQYSKGTVGEQCMKAFRLRQEEAMEEAERKKIREHVMGHGTINTVFETGEVSLNEDRLKPARCDRWRVGASDFGWAVYVQGRNGPYMSFPTQPLAMMVYEFLTGHTGEAELLRERVNAELPKAP